MLKSLQVVEAAELLGVEVEEILIGEKQQQVLNIVIVVVLVIFIVIVIIPLQLLLQRWPKRGKASLKLSTSM